MYCEEKVSLSDSEYKYYILELTGDKLLELAYNLKEYVLRRQVLNYEPDIDLVGYSVYYNNIRYLIIKYDAILDSFSLEINYVIMSKINYLFIPKLFYNFGLFMFGYTYDSFINLGKIECECGKFKFPHSHILGKSLRYLLTLKKCKYIGNINTFTIDTNYLRDNDLYLDFSSGYVDNLSIKHDLSLETQELDKVINYISNVEAVNHLSISFKGYEEDAKYLIDKFEIIHNYLDSILKLAFEKEVSNVSIFIDFYDLDYELDESLGIYKSYEEFNLKFFNRLSELQNNIDINNDEVRNGR